MGYNSRRGKYGITCGEDCPRCQDGKMKYVDLEGLIIVCSNPACDFECIDIEYNEPQNDEYSNPER